MRSIRQPRMPGTMGFVVSNLSPHQLHMGALSSIALRSANARARSASAAPETRGRELSAALRSSGALNRGS
jgi:hypothetical protein